MIVQSKTSGFPSNSVYHWNPVAFVEQMKLLASGLCFPLSFIPGESYKDGMRRFGAYLPDGRKHAGCDLYAPVGTKIYAMADGTIVDHRSYYLDMYQITVNHGDFIARCGEVKPNGERLATGLQVGSQVRKGQHIGYVDQLVFPSGNIMSMCILRYIATQPIIASIELRRVSHTREGQTWLILHLIWTAQARIYHNTKASL